MQMYVAIMTESDLIHDEPSPYRHNRFPFTPVWCYRRARDNAPYGVIRRQRDPQEDINKRGSKALFILSSNQIQMEKGAVDDLDDLRLEAARPDGIIVTNKGKALESIARTWASRPMRLRASRSRRGRNRARW
jgi:hypothetical protein